ncbi:RNA polymerase sigma factor [Austwickia chelonae]|uniref:RNA polymerase sigma factor n=1 Tax=Austwickia chelonae TaxID=100225 RepID=UPI000E26617A|nr:RNA polymerase sigma factor [Austwickia chelonae]
MNLPTDREDQQLLARIATGDEAAFTELYERHAQAVSAFATLRGTPTDEVGETVGSVWVTCWTAAAGFHGKPTVKTWLLGITARQVASRHRDRARRSAREVLVQDVPDTHRPDEPLLSALASAQRHEMVEAVRGLPPHLYETVVLAWVEELPYAEVAQLQGIPIGTVKSRISKARTHLSLTLSARIEDGR